MAFRLGPLDFPARHPGERSRAGAGCRCRERHFRAGGRQRLYSYRSAFGSTLRLAGKALRCRRILGGSRFWNSSQGHYSRPSHDAGWLTAGKPAGAERPRPDARDAARMGLPRPSSGGDPRHPFGSPLRSRRFTTTTIVAGRQHGWYPYPLTCLTRNFGNFTDRAKCVSDELCWPCT